MMTSSAELLDKPECGRDAAAGTPPVQPRATAAMRTKVATSYLLWPLLMIGAIAANYGGMQTAHPIFWFNVSYFSLAGLLFLLERLMPHERQWLANDGQLVPDIGHTLLSKLAVQALVLSVGVMGAAQAVAPPGAGWWPHGWPLPLQVLLGMTIAELGFYWAHRLAHARPLLWRFHAVHHSVTRLWFVNTGRFHFINTIISVAFGTGVALAAGVPKDILIWVSAITAYIGLLTHCNVEMRFGVLELPFQYAGTAPLAPFDGARGGRPQLRRKPDAVRPAVRHFHQPEPSPARRYRHPRADAGHAGGPDRPSLPAAGRVTVRGPAEPSASQESLSRSVETDADTANAGRVMTAMLEMVKIYISVLKAAYEDQAAI